jgi:hypothetical protein
MKTVRFAKVLESAGKPDIHLLLMEPAKDKTLQTAIKSNRVMTLYQESGSTKTDYGTVGFEEGKSRQFLVFPKTLKPFSGQRVIGIKYDLIESIPVSKNERTREPRTSQRPKTERNQPASAASDKAVEEIDRTPRIVKSGTGKKTGQARAQALPDEPVKKAPPEKLVEFPKLEPSPESSDTGKEMEELKRRVREAMNALEEGKQVAAFNLLKRIVGD